MLAHSGQHLGEKVKRRKVDFLSAMSVFPLKLKEEKRIFFSNVCFSIPKGKDVLMCLLCFSFAFLRFNDCASHKP